MDLQWDHRVRCVLLGVDTTIALLDVVDGASNVILLSRAHFPLAVKVPNGLGEQFSDIGTFLLHNIPDLMPRDNIVLTPFERGIETEQSNNIRRISVKRLPEPKSVSILIRKYVNANYLAVVR
jgi:hypothetical protein